MIEPTICKKKSMPVFSFDLVGEMSGMAVIFIGEHSPLMENTPSPEGSVTENTFQLLKLFLKYLGGYRWRNFNFGERDL